MKIFYGSLIGLLWIAWFIYWRVAARNVKAVRRQETRRSRAPHIVALLAAVAMLVYPDKPGGWMFVQFISRTFVTIGSELACS
ncbi:MAG: Isoprenylcysteine carboxyl methyltransferase [Rhodospirillales bacterium]|nr:Isoprenylcysteine carboxyl methyltransferase [Rhodospirillales bacterium]